MNKRRSAFAVLIIALLVFCAAGYPADLGKGAKESPPVSALSAAELRPTEDSGADIVILMDSSGSMKKTDPRNYRKDSARLFVSLLGPDDRVGIISFGDAARTLIPLTQNTPDNRGAFIKAIGRINSKELITDITGAAKKGMEELATSKRKNRYIVIMSDGKLDLRDAEKEKASLAELMGLMPEMKNAGIKLYSIAFSELSDQKLLADMAEKTGGFFRYAAADKDIHLMFAALFEKIKSPDSVALEGDSFNIDKDVKETVLLITKQPGTSTVLLDPSGARITQGRSAKNVQWYSSSAFDMITIQEPATGKWKVRLSSHDGNKIFVLTDLKLKSSFNRNSLNKGDKAVIDAWLEKDDKRITDKEILSQVSFSAEIIGPDGRGLKIPLAAAEGADAGVYAVALNINQVGDYTIRLSAEGKTFNRTKDLQFRALEPPAPEAPQTKTAPKPSEPETVIDWEIVALALAVVTVILMGAVISLLLWARKYRKLYTASLSKPAEPLAQAAIVEAESVEPASEAPPPENASDAGAAVEEQSQPVVEEIAEQDVTEAVPAAGEPDRDSERIERLLDIIEFQKKKIAELMFVKDTFENARVRLSALQARNRLMQDKAKSIAESHGIAKEFDEPLSSLEDDASELVSYILVFEKEENRLAEKFRKWEEELERLLAGEKIEPSAETAGSTSGLEAQLRDVKEQLAQKDKIITDLEKQYEDIEKEYIILYQQSQQQQQQPEA